MMRTYKIITFKESIMPNKKIKLSQETDLNHVDILNNYVDFSRVHEDVKRIISQIFLGEFQNTKIELSERGITSDDIKALMITFKLNPIIAGTILSLDFNGNEIYEIEISETLTALQCLDASNNKLLYIHLPEILAENLKQLHLYGNLLTSFAISPTFTALKELHLNDNILVETSIPTETLKNLFVELGVGDDNQSTATERSSSQTMLTTYTYMLNNNIDPKNSTFVHDDTMDKAELAEQFISNYWKSYDETMAHDSIEDSVKIFITPEERIEMQSKFIDDLQQQFYNKVVLQITKNAAISIFNILSTWRTPELFNLHPVRSKWNLLVSGEDMKFIIRRFSEVFPQAPVFRYKN